MTYRNFEDFLGMRFAEENPEVLDDDYLDRMDQWLTELDVDTWIKYADSYAKYCLENQNLKSINVLKE